MNITGTNAGYPNFKIAHGFAGTPTSQSMVHPAGAAPLRQSRLDLRVASRQATVLVDGALWLAGSSLLGEALPRPRPVRQASTPRSLQGASGRASRLLCPGRNFPVCIHLELGESLERRRMPPFRTHDTRPCWLPSAPMKSLASQATGKPVAKHHACRH